MTLISYLSRVHFADGVLEDALHSELERSGAMRPFVMCPESLWVSEFAERVMSGFPMRRHIRNYAVSKDGDFTKLTGDATSEIVAHKSDVVVAFGSSFVIALAGRCCHDINQEEDRFHVDFFAVPGIDGLPNFSKPSGGGPGLGQPAVIICDPTLTLGEKPEPTASAAVNALSRCIEAYLSDAYNPPADGIALDGLTRSTRNLHDNLRKDTLDTRRELMAAGLNGALAQQKGTGLAQILTDALSQASGRNLDEGATKRILLPQVLEVTEQWTAETRKDQLRTVLGIGKRKSLAKGLQDFLSDLPLPKTLDRLGLTKSTLAAAAKNVISNVETRSENEAVLVSMMSAVYAPNGAPNRTKR